MQHKMPSPLTGSVSPPPSEKPFPIGFVEFVALIAGMMALNALSIDPMLPALPAIGDALGVSTANDRQWIITSYILGLGVGALFYGSLSDRFGRRPILLICMALYLLSTLLCAVSQNFVFMIIGRAASGFFAAAMRVVAISIVRDRFHGDRMASIMSLIFIVFMIVPVLAPTIGQLVLYFANWRWIFGLLLVLGVALLVWIAWRLPETLTPETRVEITLADLTATMGRILTHRSASGYMIASGVVMGALIGFILSVQQIFFDIFQQPDIFPFAFAGIASFMAIGSFFNSKLVERMGARRLSQGSLIIFILLAAIHSLVAWSGKETMVSFIVLQALTMLAFAFTGSNFSAISMEPFSRGAGLASSFQAFATTLISAVLGALIGSQFDGSTLPLALGFLVFGSAALLIVAWGERWQLFTRPGLNAMRIPHSPR